MELELFLASLHNEAWVSVLKFNTMWKKTICQWIWYWIENQICKVYIIDIAWYFQTDLNVLWIIQNLDDLAKPCAIPIGFKIFGWVRRKKKKARKSHKYLNRLSVFTNMADKWMTWRRKIILKLGKWNEELGKKHTQKQTKEKWYKLKWIRETESAEKKNTHRKIMQKYPPSGIHK